MAESAHKLLQQLAKAYRIQTSYYDVHQKKKTAKDDALLSILQALQAPLSGYGDLAACWQEVQQREQQQTIDPITIAWDGICPLVPLRLAHTALNKRWLCTLCYENGVETTWPLDLEKLPNHPEPVNAGFICKTLTIPLPIPSGYHQLRIESDSQVFSTFIISAPKQMFRHLNFSWQASTTTGTDPKKIFGLFTPIYALHSDRSFGCGDLTDLQQFISWTAEQGGRMVATLPLHAAFLDQPCEFSPYSPISRLFWNEFYLDVRLIPEFAGEETPPEVQELSQSAIVDYHGIMKYKRVLLQRMQAKCAANPVRTKELNDFITQHPETKHYAQFRALHEKFQLPWSEWTTTPQNTIDEGDPNYQYHLYVQWQIDHQLTLVRQHAQHKQTFLYLDMPLGVHRQGYDTWRYRDIFPQGISAGAPPDAVFTTGQNWGIAPLNPNTIRISHYQYFIQCLRILMPQLDLLRIDHVMNFHRLFWIADGFDAKDGAYVRYHPQEFYAILSIESHRHRVEIVGENLGTVPNHVNQLMKKHHLNSLFVLQYALAAKQHPDKPPQNSVAAINTHDMPTFAAFMRSLDLPHQPRIRATEIQTLVDLLLEKNYLTAPSDDLYTLLFATVEFLSASPARYFLLNLEDLWLETNPQNIPGSSGDGRLNWQRKNRFSLEQLSHIAIIHHLLQKVNQRRSATKTSITPINS